MNLKIKTTADFDKSFKKLAKKHKSLKTDLLQLLLRLNENPFLGTSLGNGFYKIRINITSKSVGKSGGARLITFVKVVSETLFLTYIYDKSEESTVSDKRLEAWGKLLKND